MFLPWALKSATFSSPAGSRNAKSMGILLAPGADEAVAAFRKKFPEVRCLGRKHDSPVFYGALSVVLGCISGNGEQPMCI